MVAADEEQEVRVSRTQEAVDAGLSVPEACAFAASGVDIGLLRKPVDLLRRIVL